MKKILCILIVAGLFKPVMAQITEKKNLFEAKNIVLNNIKNDLALRADGMTDENPALTTIQNERKSGSLAILYSLLLPGMGELYAGDYSSGKYFTIAEGALWGVYTGFKIYGNWQKDNFKAFAVTHAGVDAGIENSDFFADMGDYNSLEEYNADKALQQDFNEMYNTKIYHWKWADSKQRKEYRNMWVSSERAFINVRFAVAGMVLNRIISAINAARLVGRYNKGLAEQDKSLKVSFSTGNINLNNRPDALPSDFSLVLFKPL